MGKGIFVTGTGTDIGKTYVTALIVKKLADAGIRTGYYKAALSGAKSIGDSDAGYVKKIAGITQEDTSLLSYLYQNAVSPHLAAQIEGNPVDPEKIKKDFDKVKSKFDYVTVEGSGGIVCPIRWDKEHKILLEDIVKALNLNTLVSGCRPWYDQCGCSDDRIYPESWNGCKRSDPKSLRGWNHAGR